MSPESERVSQGKPRTYPATRTWDTHTDAANGEVRDDTRKIDETALAPNNLSVAYTSR